jgi:hypothetical protein
MNNIAASSSPDFFGKDSFTPFLGCIEDVNDPMRGGRVKVRCVGWHPKEKTDGEKGLKTEDLPWARVGLPTTHAQQSRIGGKHGLLPGTWVMGFFLDGEEANHPFILTTFNFTPKASDKDYREGLKGQDGKVEDSDKAFDKVEVSPKTQPNIATRTTDEQGQKGYQTTEDPSGDVPNDESYGECDKSPSRQSAAAVRRMKEDLKKGDKGNVESQNYGVTIADGLCGTKAHAREDVQKKMKEQLPSKQSRFIYNDAVWNRYTGSYLDMNGILSQLSFEVANTLKAPMLSEKAFKETSIRKKKSTKLEKKHDRDGNLRPVVDSKSTEESDKIHATFQKSMIDQLFGLTNQVIRNLNNIGQGSSNDQNQAESGASPDTNISNNEAICLADIVLNNIGNLTGSALDFIEEAVENDSSSSSSEDTNTIAQILGQLSPVMTFPLEQKYSKYMQLFNRSGSDSQDELTKNQGCSMNRDYRTDLGTQLAKMGFPGADGGSSSGSSGGGSSESSSGNGFLDLTDIGFGGYPGEITDGTINVLCEDAEVELVPDPGYDEPTITQPILEVGEESTTEDPFVGGNAAGPNFGGVDENTTTATNGNEVVTTTETTTLPGATPVQITVTQTSTTTTDTKSYGSITSAAGQKQVVVPIGVGAICLALGLPSSDVGCAKNYINGMPNNVVVVNPGKFYHYHNPTHEKRSFPSVYIPYYNATPTPVVDRASGELVAIITNCAAWGPQSRPSVSLIPDDSPVGLLTDDEKIDVRLGGFYIDNTGFAYSNPTIEIIDKDNGTNNNASASVVVVDGRIVDIEIVNSGTGFRRIPEVVIRDETGYNARVYPIMKVIERVQLDEIVIPVESIQCPSKRQQNLL